MTSLEGAPSPRGDDEPGIIVVGVEQIEVHPAHAGPHRLGLTAGLRASSPVGSGRVRAGGWFALAGACGALTAALAPGAGPAAWSGLAVAGVLGGVGARRLREAVRHAAIARDGWLVPATARVAEGGVFLELMFSTNARHPTWEQVFAPSRPTPRSWTVLYRFGDEDRVARCGIGAEDRVACVAFEGRLTPAVLVHPARPHEPVLVTEQLLEGT